jgi:hypothetical protein
VSLEVIGHHRNTLYDDQHDLKRRAPPTGFESGVGCVSCETISIAKREDATTRSCGAKKKTFLKTRRYLPAGFP